jgi:alkanesulfonate monooxygenase SsuD/methylene tetrahydromethanopterin reductase-like flavin-dependent oxidoreductase (luciferase family)
MVPLSVLDLSPIVEGGDAARSLCNSLDLARHTERLGYRRYCLAEHHNSAGIASAATAVVIAHVAAGTSTIRVGAGGISQRFDPSQEAAMRYLPRQPGDPRVLRTSAYGRVRKHNT